MNVNLFLILTQTAVNTLRNLMDDRKYNGQHIKAVRIFRRMADYVTVEKMWENPVIGSKKRFLFSVTLPGNTKAKNAIDYLLATYPNQIATGGVWWWDSRQVGTKWEVVDGVKTGNVTGTPLYPIPSQLIRFMPDIVTYNPDGTVASTTPATVLTDVNLEQGMEPRRFV